MINLSIKANVNSLTLAEIYDLLAKYSREKEDITEFKGIKFRIEAKITLQISYVITEL